MSEYDSLWSFPLYCDMVKMVHKMLISCGFSALAAGPCVSCSGKPFLPSDSTPVVESDADADADADTDTDSDTDIAVDTALPQVGPWRQVTVGNSHACGLRADQSITCWGDNYYLQTEAPEGQHTMLAAGAVMNCAIQTNGQVACWGDFGGFDTIPGGVYSSIDASHGTVCAIRSDSDVECWGNIGELPSLVEGDFSRVSVGWGQVCALRSDGSIHCWGSDWVLPPPDVYVDICNGDDFGCALNQDRELVCFGSQWSGWDTLDASLTAGPFIDISCVAYIVCMVNADRTVSCIPDREEFRPPINSNFSRIDHGFGGLCGLHIDGSVSCWSDSGELDDIPE